jgi:hypothetical protein
MVVLVAACGAKPPRPPASGFGPREGAGPQTTDRARTPQAADAATQQAGRDCDKLIAHAVELGAAERPDDQKPNADERASMQAQLKSSWTPKCEAMSSRAYECAVAARTLPALDACGS